MLSVCVGLLYINPTCPNDTAGIDPSAYARELIEREGGHESATRPFHPSHDRQGPYRGRGNDNQWGVSLADILRSIMDFDFAVIRRQYDRAANVESWGATSGWSWDAAETQWMQLRSSFPTAVFAIHHQIGREDPHMPTRAAVRWSLTGTHSGSGWFGPATGAEVHIMGITHAEWGERGLVRREFTVLDEVAVWKQIHLHTLA